MERVGGHLHQPFVIAHEDPGKGFRAQPGQHEHGHACDDIETDAFAQHVFQLVLVARAVMIAHHRRGADGITDEDRHENELHVHKHAVYRHSVFPGKPQQLIIVHHPHQG